MVIDLMKYTNMINESIGRFEKYINLPVHDSPDECDNLLNMIKETRILENIHHALQQNKPVLVHCFAGMQRSATVVICYLIKYKHMSVVEAKELMKSKRNIVFLPYPTFDNFINNYELKYK